ncbi:MAG: hypothetical protein HC846_11485 [Blastocatellia bacterium]|nr:hypothetical protein [Blastocatellia bacterium]
MEKKLLNSLPLIFVCFFQFSCYQDSSYSDEQLPTPPIYEISFIDNKEFWLVTGKGNLLHIREKGQSKEEIKFDSPVKRIFFLNANEGWALSENSYVYATRDSGNSWTKKYHFENEISKTVKIQVKLFF